MVSKEMLYVLLVVVGVQTLSLLNFDYVLCYHFSAELVTATVCWCSLMTTDEGAYDWTMELALAYWLEAEILK